MGFAEIWRNLVWSFARGVDCHICFSHPVSVNSTKVLLMTLVSQTLKRRGLVLNRILPESRSDRTEGSRALHVKHMMFVITYSHPSISANSCFSSKSCGLIRVKVLISKHITSLIHNLLRGPHILTLNLSYLCRRKCIFKLIWCYLLILIDWGNKSLNRRPRVRIIHISSPLSIYIIGLMLRIIRSQYLFRVLIYLFYIEVFWSRNILIANFVRVGNLKSIFVAPLIAYDILSVDELIVGPESGHHLVFIDHTWRSLVFSRILFYNTCKMVVSVIF